MNLQLIRVELEEFAEALTREEYLTRAGLKTEKLSFSPAADAATTADALVVESMGDIEEAKLAVAAAKAMTAKSPTPQARKSRDSYMFDAGIRSPDTQRSQIPQLIIAKPPRSRRKASASSALVMT